MCRFFLSVCVCLFSSISVCESSVYNLYLPRIMKSKSLNYTSSLAEVEGIFFFYQQQKGCKIFSVITYFMFVWTVSDNMSVQSLLPAHRSSKYNVAHKHGCFSHIEQENEDVNTQETKDPKRFYQDVLLLM